MPPEAPAAVEVWWARLSRLELPVRDALARLLTEPEHARSAAYRRPVDRLRFQVGVAITRLVLADRLGRSPGEVPLDRTCPDCARPHGKVRVPGAEWEVSVSHSGELVGVAVSTLAAVGLDVEEVRPLEVAELAPLVLAPAEGDGSLGPGEFLRYWTRKEAVTKATGEGLRQPLDRLRVTRPDEPPAVLSWAGREQTAALVSLFDLADREGHLASLAVLSTADARIVEHDAEPLLRTWAQGLALEA